MYRNRKDISNPVIQNWLPAQPVPFNAIPYVLPSDWTALPASIATEELDGIVAVFNNSSNFVAVVVSGNYTVDWGDGTILNYSAAATATHQYTYSSLPDSSFCSRGYKTVLVKITPQAGQQLTSINLSILPTLPFGAFLKKSIAPWLNIQVSGPNLTLLKLWDTDHLALGMLEQFNFLGPHKITSFTNFFCSCYKLQKVVGLYAKGITSTANMFLSCYSLQEAPFFDISSATNTSYMFFNCYNLLSIPPYDTKASLNFSFMFLGCAALKSVPLINTSEGTNFSYMFNGCYNLTTIPKINTSKGTNFVYMFYYCTSLQTIPLIDTSNGTLMNNMFSNCWSLVTVPQLNTTKNTNFTSFFSACSSLISIPLIDTSNGTAFDSMFNLCYSLTTIPALVTTKGLTFTSMFYTCTSLVSISALDTSAATSFNSMFNSCVMLQNLPTLSSANVTSASSMFASCPSLSSSVLSGLTYSVNYAGCRLGYAELLALFNALGTATGGAVLTITNNWGEAYLTADDKAIVTGKGWTLAL